MRVAYAPIGDYGLAIVVEMELTQTHVFIGYQSPYQKLLIIVCISITLLLTWFLRKLTKARTA